MHNLIKAAPEYDGTGDVEFWLHEVMLYLRRHEVNSDAVKNNVIIGALTGSAREWFGSLPIYEIDKDSLEEVV